jgi:hypothetical protein
MTTINRLFTLVALVVSCTVGCIAAPASHVSAATTCQVTPSSQNCNGRDPQLMGCDIDAYTFKSVESPYVRVALRYSPTCRSVWTRVQNMTFIPGSLLTAEILRKDGVNYASAVTYPTTVSLSRMVYVGDGQTANGIGVLQSSNGSILSYVQTGYVHP